MSDYQDSLHGSEIAVVGMAGRFPGADTPDAFWDNLRNGVESITVYTDDELRAEGVSEALLRNPHYVRSGAPVNNMEMFDAGFFGFSQRDAAVLDPQHRHFLEVSWEALENAGYDPSRYDGPIGVFGGSGHNAYMPYNLLTNPDLMNSMGFFLVRHTGNDKDFLTTRVSYLLDLKGPSINVQTACSTSLVAIHVAIQSLLNLECDMALAGGVTFELPHRQGYVYEDGEILSPDGHCRAFDADSQGTVFGSGVGVVVLKRLDDALEDGDTIHAVIKGSAINNDGAGKVSYLAPSVDGQSKAIIEAIETADVDASSISYVETHGTGTPIGDPIETTALIQAFRSLTDGPMDFKVGIGSVKTNIGHLDTAAGVASFIKLVQALKHKQLPASLNFRSLNPAINFENTPFYVNAELTAWESPAGALRRGGVSSLGVGGTNAHIILEEAPARPPSAPPTRDWQILPLSARSRAALDASRERLAEHLNHHPGQNLADVAHTLKVGRKAFAQRGVIVARSHAEAAEIAAEGKHFASGVVGKGEAAVVFMFPGGGAQYPNMGRDLYETEPLYRQIVDDCFALLDFDLKPYLFPPDGADLEAIALELERPSLALPALFITEYALARLWMSWGIQPRTMTGHSMGEYTAAALAGVMTMAEGLRIVTVRGRLFETLPEGGMISVLAPEESVRPLLIDALDIAVINSPNTCVVSGEVASIERMEAVLTGNDLQYKRVPINVAAHSPMLEPILEAFLAEMQTIRLQPPQIPYITNVTGTWVKPEDATDPAYWVRHLRHTVRFGDGIAALPKDSNPVLLEVGPGKTLTALARQHPDAPANPTLLTSLRPPQETISDQQFILMTLGRIWAAGYALDWEKVDGPAQRYRVPLPTYPFEHQRYWVEPGNPAFAPTTSQAILARSASFDDWFYKPAWRQTPLVTPPTESALRWLVTLDETGLGTEIAQQLKASGQEVVTVEMGWVYEKLNTHSYKLDPPAREEYTELFESLMADDLLPDRIVHTWSVTGDHPVYARESFYEKRRDQGLYSLMVLAQVLDDINHTAHIGVISDGMQRVDDEQLPYPEKATLLGPVRVIPQEMPRLTCQSIDLTVNTANHERYASAEQIIAELTHPHKEAIIAYRNGQRWVQTYVPAPLPPVQPDQTRLRHHGVYLITGGLGGIGLTMAEHLARTVQARLVLIGRSGLPPRESWDEWIREHGPNHSTSQRIRKVQHLESFGAEVLVLAANVIIPRQLEQAVSHALEHFGAIHGLIHAAGTLNDNLIQLKTTTDTEQVLAPKVRGALYLNDLLRGQPLDFVVLFSSTSTLIGSAGQVDYIAANAVLNAMAESQNANGGPYTVAINWGIWQEVGMAHATAVEMGLVNSRTTTGHPMKHPLLGNIITDQATELVYSNIYTVDDYWLLNEHRIKNGEALIPGTGYLEIIKAALAKDRPHIAMEIEELYFVAALDVRAGEQRQVQVALTANAEGYDFIISSQPLDGDNWQDHAYGRVRELRQPAPNALNIAEITAHCTAEHHVFEVGQQDTQQERHLDFGPRWKNLRQVHLGEGQALAHLVLQDQFVDDLNTYTLHPALMDLATGFALPLVPGYRETNDLFVPFSYRQVRVYGPLPQRIYSYARLGAVAENLERVSLNLTITDEHGQILVTIDAFTMVRIDPAQMIAESARRDTLKTTSRPPENDRPTLLQLGITDGIRPEEGVAAFTRVLSKRGGIPSQVIVSSLPLAPLIDYLHELNAPAQATGGMKFERPAHLQSAYVAPENEIERKLVQIWEDSLGIQGIGTQDDFFDLGGESLIAVRVFMAVKKAFAVDLALDTLLQVPTITQLAEILHLQVGDHHETPDQAPQESLIIPLQSQGTKAPLFCIHDLNGFVLYYRDLAKYLPHDRPLYAIQAHGINSRQHGFDSSIDAMSDRYLDEIRRVQPEGPYFLCGSSLGGLVAYDIAQKLIAKGQEVAFLGVFDSWHPAYLVEVLNPPRAYSNPAGRAIMHLREFTGKGPAQYLHQRRQNRDRWQAYQEKLEYQARQREAVQHYLHNGDPMPEKLRTFHREELFGHAYQSYVPAPYPGRMTLFIAEERTLNDNDPKLGWERIPIKDLVVYKAPGPHGFMIRDPYVAGLAVQLQQCVDHAQAEYDQHP